MPDVQVLAKPEIEKVEPADISLEPGEFGAILELIVKDKAGNIKSFKRMKSRSFVSNFMRLLYLHLQGFYTPHTVTITDTSGNPQNEYCYNARDFRADESAGAVLNGIIVGTDNTAPTINDTALGTPIAHGVGAGQLQYSAVTFGAPAVNGNVSQFTVTRDFANGSGGAITVEEIALYVLYGSNHYYMTIRDVTGGTNVPNGDTLTVNYRLQVTV